MLRPMAKTTVFTLQNVPENCVGKSVRRASSNQSLSCFCVKQCLASLNACATEYIDLRDGLPNDVRDAAEEAGLGIIRNAPDKLWGVGTTTALEAEFDAQRDRVNKKEWSRRHARGPPNAHDGVINLRLRWHLYIAESSKSADYPNDQAEVVAFDSMPLAKRWRDKMVDVLRANGVDCPELTSCTNINYVDGANGTGIGWHGDGERTIIVTLRLHEGSETNLLRFHWTRHGQPVGRPICVTLKRGDAYIMSCKATGNDWLDTSKEDTLIHAAGGAGCYPASLDALYKRVASRKRKNAR